MRKIDEFVDERQKSWCLHCARPLAGLVLAGSTDPEKQSNVSAARALTDSPALRARIDEASLAPWPEVGSRMATRLLTGEDTAGHWVVVQDGIYRYSVQQTGGLRVRSVLSEYLATEIQ
jgi:hypothetical protein